MVDFDASLLTPRVGAAPLTVTLLDNSVVDGLQDPTSRDWTVWRDDGDGLFNDATDTQEATSSSLDATFTFETGGDFHVRFIATNAFGSTTKVEPLFIRSIRSDFSITRIVRGEAAFDLATGSGQLTDAEPLVELEFASDAEGSVTSYAWDLDGDGRADSTAQNPSFTYRTAGSFNVFLRVTGPAGFDDETMSASSTCSAPRPRSSS